MSQLSQIFGQGDSSWKGQHMQPQEGLAESDEVEVDIVMSQKATIG